MGAQVASTMRPPIQASSFKDLATACVPKTRDLRRLRLTPGLQEGEEKAREYSAVIIEVPTLMNTSKTHNKVVGALVQLRGRNGYVTEVSAWPMDNISDYN